MTQKFDVLLFSLFPEILTLLLPAGCCILIGDYKYQTELQRPALLSIS